MKKIRIYFSSDLADPTNGTAEIEGPEAAVDFSALIEHYRTLGENYLKDADKFIMQWKEEWGPRLFDPKARILLMSDENMRKNFGDVIDFGKAETTLSALIVWTVGEAIEKKSEELMSQSGNLMSGMLLDVAGSVALYSMHRPILEWLSGKVCREHSKYISAEVYPGFTDVSHEIMDRIEKTGNTEKTIGVRAEGSSMLRPRKTQCSFVGFGTNEIPLSSAVRPCVPCSGKKCLCWQLGGCHMDVLRNK
jgi:hypothetical protein